MPPTIDLARFPRTALPERDGPLRVLYAGTVGLAQGLETVLAAARHSDVEVTVAGGGARLDSLRRSAPANVLVLGPVAPARVPALYARAHAGLVPLRDRPVLEGALPTKLLEVLAAGRPAVVSAHGEAAALVREAGAGVVCRPGDPTALAAAFTSLRDLDRMGAAGRAWVERHATLDTGVARWLALLGSL